MRISDWSSDVCSSDLSANSRLSEAQRIAQIGDWEYGIHDGTIHWSPELYMMFERDPDLGPPSQAEIRDYFDEPSQEILDRALDQVTRTGEPQEYELRAILPSGRVSYRKIRSEEHTYELQSLMRNSYAVYFLKKKNN